MKNLTKNQIQSIIVIMFGILIFIICALGIQSSNRQIELVKKDIEIQELEEVHQIRLESARKPSYVEELSGMAEVYRRNAVEELEFAQAGIARGEEMLLKAKCYKEQVNRLMNNKEFSGEYCEVLENLEQYKVKK